MLLIDQEHFLLVFPSVRKSIKIKMKEIAEMTPQAIEDWTSMGVFTKSNTNRLLDSEKPINRSLEFIHIWIRTEPHIVPCL